MGTAPTELNIRSCEGTRPNPESWRVGPNEVATGFNEGGKYRIRVTGQDDRLLIDDETLKTDGDDWVWSPGFYAGQVSAELLRSDGRSRAKYVLDVSPHPDKLGREMFDAMLNQIWEFDSRLVLGTEPAALPVGHEGDNSTPWLQYARLRTYGDKFLRALSVISRQPLRELVAERAHLPPQLARRADRQTALTALRTPHVLSILGLGGNSTLTGTPLHFDVPVARETLDSAANRCIAAIVRAVLHRTARLKQELREVVDKESASSTRTPLSGRWQRREEFLDRIEHSLRKLQRTSPLSEVTRQVISVAGLNAVSADPAYSSVYGLGWRILRLGADGAPQPERLWISPTWEIYERWCFVQLGKDLARVFDDHEWRLTTNRTSYAKAAFTAFKDGERKFELLLQPRFPAGDKSPNSRFQSISGEREPDIVLKRNDGENSRWYVFDAKYRTGRSNVLKSMASAHIYRDALRWNGRRPDRVLLLTPRAEDDVRWLKRQDFIREHGVGVHALAPDTDSRSALDLLLANTDKSSA